MQAMPVCNQRQLYLERTSTQRSRSEMGGSQGDRVVPNMSFTEWIPVPPSPEESIIGILPSGLERLGISEGFSKSKFQFAKVARKPPIWFVVKPGQEDVVAEFAEFNSSTRTRAMATTSVKSKPITVPGSFGVSGAVVNQRISLEISWCLVSQGISGLV